MNAKTRNLLMIAAVTSIALGALGAITQFLKESYIVAVLGMLLFIAGVILLAIVFGDEDDHDILKN